MINFIGSIKFVSEIKESCLMAMYLWTILTLSISMILPDWWFYRKMKKHDFFRWFRILSLVPAGLFIVTFFYIRYGLRHSNDFVLSARISWVFIILSLIYIPKVIYIVFYYVNRLYSRIFNTYTRIFRQIGFALSIFFVSGISFGLIVTRDNFHVKNQIIEIQNLPAGFDGYKLALIADLHLGNWNRKFSIMEPIVQLINEQNADVIIFAGDLINNYEAETVGWEPYFKRLKSKSGLMYAVLGNHDYGDYTHWDTPENKIQNLEKTKQNIRNLGFRLLLNEHEELVSKGDTITIVGVENFGSGHFDDYSDLKKALENTVAERKKILVTHDPNHWNAEVVGKQPDIFLTLSGHTHAGQLGFVRKGFKISLASLIYPQWDGLYSHGEQYIYVNRGIGFVGVPIRIGVPPEITLIELRRK